MLSTRLEDAAAGDSLSGEMQSCCRQLAQLLQAAHENSTRLIAELQSLAEDAGNWFSRMDFGFLLERRRKLLSIGYEVESGTLHQACYDLLASESRIATFVAIAKGDIPQEIWFLLGRGYVLAGGRPVLASWTGTMFEYLMPAIWMRSYPDTLLRRSAEGAIRAQQVVCGVEKEFRGEFPNPLITASTKPAIMDTALSGFHNWRCRRKIPKLSLWRRTPRSWRLDSIPRPRSATCDG